MRGSGLRDSSGSCRVVEAVSSLSLVVSLTVGTRLGPYEILAPIGAGGMGEVYRAWDTRLSREVAVKVLPAAVASDPDTLARFECQDDRHRRRWA
jgi:serine/threonine protein kinase